MKRLWAAIGLLLFILCACVLSAAVVSRYADTTITHLESAIVAAERKDYSTASRHCNAASEHWGSKSGLLGSLLRHSEADQVETGLAQLISYSETEDHDEFLALCSEVIHNINHVRDMELPLLRNIL